MDEKVFSAVEKNNSSITILQLAEIPNELCLVVVVVVVG